MKTRVDFVSNSSSCSFVISNAVDGIAALKDFGILDANDIDDLRVRFTLDEHIFNALKMPELESWRDDIQHKVFCSCYPSSIIELPKLAIVNMQDLSFECDDCEQHAVFALSLLFEALRIKGVEVCNDESELDFPNIYDSNCIASKLLKYISKRGMLDEDKSKFVGN